MKQYLAVFAVSCVALGVLVSCGGDESAPDVLESGSRPVIILAIDGLRADGLGSYGALTATPAFDALAAESVRFEWAFAQAPQIHPSLATLFSGLYPTTNGMRAPGDYLVDDAQTLAEIFGSAGFATGAFLEGSPASSDYGLAQGFETFEITPGPGDAAIAWMTEHKDDDFLLVLGGWSRQVLDEVDAVLEGSGRPEDFSQRIQEVLGSRAGETPLSFTDEELEWARAWYAARIQVIDSLLDGFMQTFRSLGLDRRAVLVVVGSNGFALQEHGGLFGESLHTPVTHVPMMLRLPDGQRPQAISKVVEVIDLMPTVLELAGLEVPAGVQGASLTAMIIGGGQPPYIAFAESPQLEGQRMVALGGMAMVSGAGGAGGTIFDLMSDPQQLDDLASTEADKLGVMKRYLEAWEKMVAATSLDPNLRSAEDLDEETLKQLRSLGYIQ